MLLSHWLKTLTTRHKRRTANCNRQNPWKVSPKNLSCVESLEDRTLLATFVVDDNGAGDHTTIAAAIAAASNGDEIQITGGVDRIHTEADITVNKNLTIEGIPGTTQVIVQAATTVGTAGDRIFLVSGGATVSMENLTLRHGRDTAGGAVANVGGTLTISDSAIINNEASGPGGGIYNSSSGTLIIERSTIANNVADDGGGIHNTSGSATILNSTVSQNLADVHGGGVFNVSGEALTIVNTTITGNTANFDQIGTGEGGGIQANGSETVSNTIVAGNFNRTATMPVNPNDIQGTIETAFNNLIGDQDSRGGINNGINGNLVGNGGTGTIDITTVLNTTLADNGGPTLTHALVTNSPAIDVGGNSEAENAGLTTDQRGIFSRFVSGVADIGAVEFVRSFTEAETNNTPGTAQSLAGLGTGTGDTSAARISGTQGALTITGTPPVGAEPNDTIANAQATGLSTGDLLLFTGGNIGDGPFGTGGTGQGDFDFFAVNATIGQEIFVQVDTANTFGGAGTPGLDAISGIYNSAGDLLYYNDDFFFGFNGGGPPANPTDSSMHFVAPATGTFYVVVGGALNLPPKVSPALLLPSDPTTGGSGIASSTGDYNVLIGLDYGDQDFYSVDLEAGDILSAGFDGSSSYVSLRAPNGSEMYGFPFDATGIGPASSPLNNFSGLRNGAIVAPATGTYTIGLSGLPGNYDLNLEVFRPVLEQEELGTKQILFIDFDGETLNPSIFPDPSAPDENRTLSPLTAFLSNWGLIPGDENAVIDAILAEVVATLETDIAANGNNPGFDIEIRNSRDHADTFGTEDHVSRVIVGGSIGELGIPTLGIAESVDLGNFNTTETAVVLLDLLSAPAGGDSINALNGVNAGNIVQAIGRVVGQITAHEAGHFFGAFHTENTNDVGNTIDQGGNGIADEAGVGPDGIFGNADDVMIRFTSDVYSVEEGFTGTVDSRNVIAFGLSSGTVPPPINVVINGNGDLEITGTAMDDDITITFDGTNILVNGVPTLLTDITNAGGDEIILNLGDGNDTLTIDASVLAGTTLAINYDGQGQTAMPGDSLVVTGGNFATGVYDARTNGSGTLNLDGSVITFTGLEPVDLTGSTIVDFTIDVDDTNTVAGTVTTTIAQDSVDATDTIVSFDNGLELFEFRSITGTLTINGDANDPDIFNVNSVGTSFAAGLDINGQSDDTVNLNGAITFAADRSLTVDAMTINAPNATSDYATTGTGSIVLTATRNIVTGSGSSFTTVNGGITLSANQQVTPAVGDFIGIDAENTLIQTTGTGNIQILGKGAEVGGDTPNTHGVHLHNGTSVSSTATGATAGTITLNGTGGNGTTNNHGVFLLGNTTDVTSVDGAISITGQGGNGSGNSNQGVRLEDIETIQSTGTGANAATISILGTGGVGAALNHGVVATGFSTEVRTVDGNISITGTGADGTGGSNDGVIVSLSSDILATGTADISITGNAGNGTFANRGLTVQSTVSATSGTITLNGTGNGVGGNENNQGVILDVSSRIVVTTGSISVTGTAGTANSAGVLLNSTEVIADGSGTIAITGTGSGTGADVLLSSVAGSLIGDGTSVGFSNPASGDITINANSIDFSENTLQVRSTGDLTVQPRTANTAINLGTGATDSGLQLTDAELSRFQNGFNSITIGDAVTGSGTITVNAVTFNDPVTLTSPLGDVVVNGQITGADDASVTLTSSNSTTTLNADIVTAGNAVTITNSAVLDTTVTIDTTNGGAVGTGANVTFQGTIEDTSGESNALTINAGSVGDVDLQGAIGGTQTIAGLTIINANDLNLPSVGLESDASVTQTAGTGTTTVDGTIASTGTGTISLTTARNIMVDSGSSLTTVNGGVTLSANQQVTPTVGDFVGIDADNTMIQTTGTGTIQILGKGAEVGGNTANTFGVYLHSGTSVTSNATGATAGQIMINGLGGNGTNTNYGVYLEGNTTDVTSVDGAISITGQGGNGSISRNIGVYLEDIETIQSTGTGTNAATITINGTGGSGMNSNSGVHLEGNTTDVTSVDGAILITGQGGSGSGQSHFGVHLDAIDRIQSTGTGVNAATITIDGTGGSGTDFNIGVHLFGNLMEVTSVAGAISITGQGGTATGNNNFGVDLVLDATVQVTNGSLDVSGTAGSGNSSGVVLAPLNGGRLLSVGTGDITINATGNGTSPDLEVGSDSRIGFDGTNPTTSDITIIANSIALSGTTNIESDGNLLITPRTASTTIGLGGGAGTLNLDDTELGFLQDGFNSITIGDTANGTGAVDIDSATFNDPVTIVGGPIDVDGLNSPSNAVTLSARTGDITTNGGVAGGNDITGGLVTLNGSISPGGSSAGQLVVVDDLTLGNGDTYVAQLNGSAPGTGFDQIVVNGDLVLNDGGGQAVLSTSRLSTFIPTLDPVEQSFLIVSVGGNITGEFAGRTENSTFTIDDITFRINYQNNVGVTLTVVRPTTVYVDDNFSVLNPGDDPTGMALVFGYDAFATIQDGVDAVIGDGTGMVLVSDGTYNEAVTIDKNITLDGAGPGTIINATGDGVTLDTGANSVTIRDFRVQSTAGGIVDMNPAPIASLTLANLQIDGNGSNPGGSLDGVTNLDVTLTGNADVASIDNTTLASTGFDAISYANVGAIVLNGANGDDTFNVDPIASTNLTVNGDIPVGTSPGDTLNYSGTAPINLGPVPGSGTIVQTPPDPPIQFTGIETITSPFVSGTNGDFVISAGPDADDGDSDAFIVRRIGANIEVLVVPDAGPPVLVFSQPFAAVNSLTIEGSTDDDTLTVDYDGDGVGGIDVPIPVGGLFFNGNGDGISDNDVMVIEDGTVTAVTHTFASSHSGTVAIQATAAPTSTATLTYTGLEPITDTLIAPTRTFNFGAASDQITLSDDNPNVAGLNRISSAGTSETVDFASPTADLIINAGSGDDTITVLALDNSTLAMGGFNANLTINGEGDKDTINLQATTDVDNTADNVYTLNGGDGADEFNIAPTPDALSDITINGNNPGTPSGDVLNYNGTAAVTPTILGSGTVDPATDQDVAFTGIEMVNTINPPQLTIGDVTVAENVAGGMVTLTVMLSRGVVQPVTVDVITASGTATVGSDFTGINQTLTFSPGGPLMQMVTISIANDAIVELDEEFLVNLSNATGAAIVDGTANVTITDDDNDVAAMIGINDVVQTEGDGGQNNFVFTITLDKAVDAPVSLQATAVNGTAMIAMGDFLANTQIVTFQPGELSKTFTVQVNGDLVVEDDETFVVNLTGLQAGGRNVTVADPQGQGTITNDDTATISIADLSQVETDGNTNFIFTVTLDRTVDTAVTFNAQTNGVGTATSGTDYTELTATGRMFAANSAPGSTTTVTVEVLGDTTVEPDETFQVLLDTLNAGGRSVQFAAGGIGTGTILNDDAATISIGDVTLIEGDSGTSAFDFNVVLSNPITSPVTVQAATLNLDAIAGVDYVFRNDTVTFTPGGSLTEVFSVDVVGDLIVEDNEQFIVQLSNPVGATIADGVGLGTITNNDTAMLSINDVSTTEDGVFTFTITLSNRVADVVTVEIDTAETTNGNNTDATSGTDFTAITDQVVTFSPGGSLTQTVTVQVDDDAIMENDETFEVQLSNALLNGNADLRLSIDTNNNVGEGTIQNNDIASLSINDVTAREDGSFVFTVSLSNPISENITFQVDTAETANGNNTDATSDVDFTSITAQSFGFTAGGALTTNVPITVSNDDLVELAETFNVLLSNAVFGTGTGPAPVIGDNTGLGTILNDDIDLDIAPALSDRLEGNSGDRLFTFTVTRTGDLSGVTTVDYEVTGTGADPADADDFGGALPMGQVVFEAGQSTQTITILVEGDLIVEDDEAFLVTLMNPSVNAQINTTTAMGTIRNDDVTILTIANVSQAEGDAGNTVFDLSATLTQPVDEAVTLTFNVMGTGPNSVDAADFPSGFPTVSFTFMAGETTATTTLDVAGDLVVEPNETFTFALNTTSNESVLLGPAAIGTILNDDIDLAIVPANVTRNEGNAGDTAFTYTVTRTGDLSGSTTVDYMVTGSGGLNGSDFGGNLPMGQITFAPGQNSQTLPILVAGDQIVELDETFTVTLMNPSGNAEITPGSNTATGTITNDDTATLTISNVTQAEGDGGGTAFQFTATLSQLIPQDVTANFQVVGSGINPATVGDFVGGVFPSGMFTILAGQISETFTVNVAGDFIVEPNETFSVSLNTITNPTVIAGPAATGTILNDDFSVAIGPVTIDRLEGNVGDTSYVYTLTRTGDVSNAVTLNYEVTGSGLHQADASDFAVTTGTATFNPGAATTTLVVLVQGDQTVEHDEGFTVSINDPNEKAEITTDTATGTIRNDDTTVISINSVSGLETDGLVTFTVSASNPFAEDIELTLNKTTGSAGIDDFDTNPQTVTLMAGTLTTTVDVTIADDELVEFAEMFEVSLQKNLFGTEPADSRVQIHNVNGTGTGTITDNDQVVLSIVDAMTINEEDEDAGTMTFSIQLSDADGTITTGSFFEDDNRVTVDVIAVPQSALGGGTDYTFPPMTLTFDANDMVDGMGNVTKDVMVQLTDDDIVELDEQFVIQLVNPRFGNTSDGFVTDANRVTIDPMNASRTGQINDEDEAQIWISDQTGTEGGAMSFTVTLDGVLDQDVTLLANTQTTVPVSAMSDVDFTSVSNLPLTFNANSTATQTRTVVVQLNDDGTSEPDEQFLVQLSDILFGGTTTDNRVQFVLDPADSNDSTPGEAVGTIQDQQPPVEVTFSEDKEGDESNGSLTFTINLSGAEQDPVTVIVSTMMTSTGGGVDAVDTNDEDFTGLDSFPVVFAPGELSRTVTVQLTPDAIVEPDETFLIEIDQVLVGPTGNQMVDANRVIEGSQNTATGTILNDDFANLTITGDTMNEGNPGGNNLVTFQVALDAIVQGGLTIDYMTVDGTANVGQDFQAPAGTTLTFGESPNTQQVTVSILEDLLTERDESFLLALSNLVTQNLELDAVTVQTNATGTITNDDSIFVTGPDVGGGPNVIVTNQLNQTRFSFMAYESGFTGGVRVATGDVNGDGVPDVITAPGPGRDSTIRVFDGVTNGMIANFTAYPGFMGGVFVTAADVVGNDGIVEIITAPDATGGPHVKVFTGVNLDGSNPTVFTQFMTYAPGFMGGVRIATGDVTGDGTPDLISGPGPGGGPNIRVFDLTQPQGGLGTDISAGFGAIGNFMAFDANYTGGVFVAAGDFGGDSINQADVIVGRSSGTSRVRIFDAEDLSFMQIDAFPGFGGGVRVATVERFGNATPDLVVAAGPTGGPNVQIYNGGTVIDVNAHDSSDLVTMTESELDPDPRPGVSFDDFAYNPAFTGGVFVAGTVFPPFAGSPLRLAENSILPSGPVKRLSQAELNSTFAAAVTRLEQAGLDSSVAAQLAGTPIVIGNLAPGLLGLATGNGILIDDDAAGAGWFVDLTPDADEEYQNLTSQGLAATSPAALGGVDLLTVVLHELGHVLGFEDLNEDLHQGDLMAETLAPNLRRLPDEDSLDELFAEGHLLDDLLLTNP